MALEVLAYILVVAISTAIVWKGSSLLEEGSDRLATYYQLPETVQGSLVAAVGSSFPELTTTVLSTLVHGKLELGVAAILGSAIFNILVIPGLSGLTGRGPIPSSRDLVHKEAQFYLLSVAVLLSTLSLAVIYAPVPDPLGSGRMLGEVSRGLALVPLATYGLYVFVQWADTQEHEAGDARPEVAARKEWGRFLLGLLLILVGVEGLVRSAVRFGELFDTPSFFWGVTVVAAGTSIPDAFVSVRAARQGRGIPSLANVLGSNVFDLLVALPAGILVAGSAVLDFGMAAPLIGALTLATIALFLALRTQMRLTRRESIMLLVLYGAFVGWMVLEQVGVTSLLPERG